MSWDEVQYQRAGGEASSVQPPCSLRLGGEKICSKHHHRDTQRTRRLQRGISLDTRASHYGVAHCWRFSI